MCSTSPPISILHADLTPQIFPGAMRIIFIKLKLKTDGSVFALNADVIDVL